MSKRRITILGMGPSAYRKADNIEQYTEGTELWSLNNAYLTYPHLFEGRKFDRMYELHSWDYLQTWQAGKVGGSPVDHFKTLEACKCDVWTTQPLPVIMRQLQFPLAEILHAFGRDVEVKGSPSWMLAHALYEHACGNEIEYIQSYGIDTKDPSHMCQRPSWSQWCVRAEAMGIELGGTMTEFRNEPDQDEGLNGLLDHARMIYDQSKTLKIEESEENNELRSG